MEKAFNYYINPLEKIGEGAFGYVEKVELYNSDLKLCGVYSRKILSPKPGILANVTIEEVKRRFIREAVYQSKCVHDNVVYIYIFNKYAENPYFIMDLAENDLQDDIDSNILSEEEKVNVLQMMLQGLKMIHMQGYLHRDIKPQNVLRFSHSMYKISDFGLAKDNVSNNTTVLTAIGQIMGTTKYMAPEILIDAHYSKSGDIYALGKVAKDLNIKSSKYDDLLKKCIAMDIDHRYSDVEEVISDFKLI